MALLIQELPVLPQPSLTANTHTRKTAFGLRKLLTAICRPAARPRRSTNVQLSSCTLSFPFLQEVKSGLEGTVALTLSDASQDFRLCVEFWM